MDTSTLLGGVAVIKDGQVLSIESSLRQKSHTEIISPFVESCLTNAGIHLSEVGVFAVGQGPGSFTGIRVAANAGKSYAYAFGKPMVTIDSLTLLASTVRETTLPILAIMNAYKNMVYLGLFDLIEGQEPRYRLGPIAVPVRELPGLIKEKVLVVGDGYETYQEYLSDDFKKFLVRDAEYSDYPTAEALGLLAEKRALTHQTIEWNSFIPLYIRASEAEESKRGIIISPLK
ncbi:MAG: tRNA (adenosine(37)-N6)-threonylcarbamoyltransferase complex dimerization subunit type 1 TsaB [Proteobacteria bacterium]|nr:MAG: tRNA (adenosine(37)-N6)-threonylcarbamoyltransferase complex dimerization subunit type 1 TsaB [Pseudomonadota bacterium]